MDFLEAVEAIKNPNDKYDIDMIAIRVVVLELLKRTETEVLANEPIKKGKKK